VSIAGCDQVQEFMNPAPPDVSAEWTTLLAEVRAFERRIGFRETENFRSFSGDHVAFPFCGYVSRFYLPYSYQDTAIRWIESATEEECREAGRDADTYFGFVEAWGESATPVTPSMVDSRLDRFLYLVIHEDCHDQFDFPFGIEEALCNVITYKAMATFSAERYGRFARANRAVRRYADTQARITKATIGYYERLAALYLRHERAEISSEVLLRERSAIFRQAERALARGDEEMNNVTIANEMTYSRHYPFLESAFDALGRDLPRTIAFFMQVDKIKPSEAAVMKEHGIADENGVRLVSAYEEALVAAIRQALAANF
jgi:putative aminopeptidase